MQNAVLRCFYIRGNTDRAAADEEVFEVVAVVVNGVETGEHFQRRVPVFTTRAADGKMQTNEKWATVVYSQVKRRFHRGFKTAAKAATLLLLLLPVPKEPNQKLPDGTDKPPWINIALLID